MSFRLTRAPSLVISQDLHLPNLARLAEALGSGASRLDDIPNIDRLFDAFARSREYERIYIAYLDSLVSRPPSRFDQTIGSSFSVFRNESFLVAIQLVDGSPTDQQTSRPKTIATTLENGLQAVINRGSTLTIEEYRLPSGTDVSVFDPDIRLIFSGHYKMEPESGSHRYSAGSVYLTEQSGPVCIVRLREVATLDFQWTFDSTGLTPLYHSVSLPSLGRFETIIDLISSFAGERMSLDTATLHLAQLSKHRLHFVRWKAVQSLGRIDGALATDILKSMLDDPHPHVRLAANDILIATDR